MNFCLAILLLIPLWGAQLLADEPASFVIEGEIFHAQQKNVYRLGNYDKPLTEEKIIALVKTHQYEFSLDYVMEYERYSYWVYFVDNLNDKPQKIFLRYPMLMPESKAWLLHEGRLVAFEAYPVAFDIFFVEIPPGRSTIVGSRLSGGNVTGRAATISIKDFASTARMVSFEQHVMGGLLGAVAIMILYNLGMYLFFKRIYFIYYAIYTTASTYALMIFSGYLSWSIPRSGVGLAIAGVGLILFCNSSLSMRSSQPKLYKISLGFLIYCVVFGCYVLIAPSWNIISLSVPATMLFCVYVSVRRAWDGYRPAIYLVVGWTAMLIASVGSLVNLAFFGSFLLGNLNVYGLALEICFFSFAIGQKVRLSEQKALRESEHAFNQMKKVFYPHQIEQIKFGVELEKTMPTGKGRAAVINFDIIESSKIRQPEAKGFIESSIKSCVSIISENYDSEQMRSNGYRIKEVGDGFLCSVGYPFKVPHGTNTAECAVELALRFVSIFQKQVDQLLDHHPVFCSIGIATDWLEGYYPKVGTIEYDVYGRAIILATRYESLRRQLFTDGVPGHIVTIQEKVFASLPKNLQETFTEVDLHSAHLIVRDDLGASKLYYRVVKSRDLEQLEKLAI